MPRRLLAIALTTATPALFLAGCGGDEVIDSAKAAKLVRKILDLRGDSYLYAKGVACPAAVKVRVGASYSCVTTGLNGNATPVPFRVRDANGTLSPVAVRPRLIDAGKAEALIRKNLVREGVKSNRIADVSCPSGVKSKTGAKFSCILTASDGTKAKATFEILDATGDVTAPAFTTVP